MEVINTWINCILVAVVMMGTIEIIVPEGETKRFVFLVTGVITSVIIATPVMKVLNSDFNIKDVLNLDSIEDNFYYMDSYKDTINRQTEALEEVFADNILKKFNNTYFDMKLTQCNITFEYDKDGKIIKVDSIWVMCEKKVDDIMLLKRRVAEICEVSIEKVSVS